MTTNYGLISAMQRQRAARPHDGLRTGHTPLPLTRLIVPAATVRTAWTHRITILDASGRVHDKACADAAGLAAGAAVAVRLDGDVVSITAGQHTTLDARGRLKLTGAVRSSLGWEPGAAVLVSARPGELVLRSTAALDLDGRAA